MAMGEASSMPAVLDEEHAAFIQQGVSIIVCSRTSGNVTDVARGCGCRVSGDRRQVVVLVERSRTSSMLEDFQANGMIAVVFSQPSTHRTIQLKGTDAHAARLAPADRTLLQRHADAWAEDLAKIGYTAEFARALHGEPRDDLVAIGFTPTAAFLQTPGPQAGKRLHEP
jgi:hypothetical protein